MLAKLKPMPEIIRHTTVYSVERHSHYWKFYHTNKPTLGFRDFYLKYWKGDRLVTVKPKRDRKKNIIPDKFEVYGKRGNYVFTAYRYWFEYVGVDDLVTTLKDEYTLRPEWVAKPKPKHKARDIARKRALTNLSWNELFDI